MPDIPVAGQVVKETPRSERRWVRSRDDGQLGWLEENDGRLMVRLDRPAEKLFRPYHQDRWEVEDEDRPLSRMQVARIAYEADRSLRYCLGEFSALVKEWQSLRDEDRIAFVNEGPPDGQRRKLYDAVTSCFRIR